MYTRVISLPPSLSPLPLSLSLQLFLAQGKDILINTSDYDIGEKIGHGAYSSVFKVKLKKQGEVRGKAGGGEE